MTPPEPERALATRAQAAQHARLAVAHHRVPQRGVEELVDCDEIERDALLHRARAVVQEIGAALERGPLARSHLNLRPIARADARPASKLHGPSRGNAAARGLCLCRRRAGVSAALCFARCAKRVSLFGLLPPRRTLAPLRLRLRRLASLPPLPLHLRASRLPLAADLHLGRALRVALASHRLGVGAAACCRGGGGRFVRGCCFRGCRAPSRGRCCGFVDARPLLLRGSSGATIAIRRRCCCCCR